MISQTLSLIANHKSTVKPIVLLFLEARLLYKLHVYTTQFTYLFCACCCFTQGERKAFRTTPAENVYASLSEVKEVIMSLSISFVMKSKMELCLIVTVV